MNNLRRGALAAGCLALVSAVVPAGTPAYATQQDPTGPDPVVLYRTDEPERLAGMRVEGCAEPGTAPGTFWLWADVLDADETPTAGCAVTPLPPLPTSRQQRSASWVDDPGRVEVGQFSLNQIKDLKVASCLAFQSLPILITPTTKVEDTCNFTPLQVDTPH